MDDLKRCPGYQREPHHAPRAQFAKNRSARDGLQKRCRTCHSAAGRAHRDAIKLMTKVTPENKRCARCARVGRPAVRPIADFHESIGTIDGKRYHCKDCVRELRWESWGVVGMTISQFDSMLTDQEGRCAIPSCGNVAAPGRLLDVDHDHVTGRPRGLLCRTCNIALGNIRESVDILRDMITYLAPLE